MTTASTTAPARPAGSGTVLVAYFSRAGENYDNGGRSNLAVGNTKVLVQMLAERIECDVFEIQATDPYSTDYDDTVARNVREQNSNARPGIAGTLPVARPYGIVILASPLWNVQPPMIMRTFTDRFDFTGRQVHPLVTYAVSGLGGAPDEYRQACRGARMGEPLAVRGEEVRDAGTDLQQWASRIGLPAKTNR